MKRRKRARVGRWFSARMSVWWRAREHYSVPRPLLPSSFSLHPPSIPPLFLFHSCTFVQSLICPHDLAFPTSFPPSSPPSPPPSLPPVSFPPPFDGTAAPSLGPVPEGRPLSCSCRRRGPEGKGKRDDGQKKMCKLQLRGRITLRPGENQSCRVRVRVRVRG